MTRRKKNEGAWQLDFQNKELVTHVHNETGEVVQCILEAGVWNWHRFADKADMWAKRPQSSGGNRETATMALREAVGLVQARKAVRDSFDQINLRVSVEQKEAYRRAAAAHGRSLSDALRWVLDYWAALPLPPPVSQEVVDVLRCGDRGQVLP